LSVQIGSALIKSLFNKIIHANITLLTLGTKGSIPSAFGCQGMLYFSKTGCTLGLPSMGVLLLAKTGYINRYNNGLLIGNRKFSMIHNSKSNQNNLITFKNDKLILSHDFLE